MVMLLLGMMTGCGECEHEYNDEEITKEATCSEEGEKIITCENCGYSYTEPIPVRDDEVVVSVTDKSNLPQDADACRRRILKCISSRTWFCSGNTIIRPTFYISGHESEVPPSLTTKTMKRM